jgi:hypothetical protein
MDILLMVFVGYYILWYNYWWLFYYKLLLDIMCYNTIGC